MPITDHITPTDLKSIGNLSVLARTVVEGMNTGMHRAPDKGASIEFKQHRPYVPGDDLRNLDWKVFAKSDRFYIREYEQETNLRATILLDCSGSMRYTSPIDASRGSKHQYAVRFAACLAYLIIRQTDSAGLVTFDTKVRHYIPPRARPGHVGVLLDAMRDAQLGGETDLGTVLRDASAKVKRRGLIVLISDCFADVPAMLRGLAHYTHARHDVMVFQLFDPDELSFPFKRWHRFDCLEVNDKHQLIDPAQLRRAYLKQLDKYRSDLRAACRRQRVDLVELTTDQPYADALAAYLARRHHLAEEVGPMSFLNFALVAGVLAFNIPMVIHLLNKSRHKRIDWGAMFLLEQVVRQNRKRVRLEQIIMLLVRCAIPVLLALAMAQPILTGFQRLVGSSPGSTVVMLDASYSMQAKDAGTQGRSRFDIAREQTRKVLSASPSSSQAQVVRVGGGFDPVTQTLTPELDRVGNQLDKLSADRAIADGPAALRQGIATLTDATTAKRDLLLISDFQRVSWAQDSGVQRDRLKEMIDAMPVKPAIVLMHVAGEVGRNLSITEVSLSSRAIGVGQRVRIAATVLNTSEQDAPDTPVVLSVDGVEQETQRLSIDAGESADLVFFHKFEEGGPHTLEVALSDGVLAADDTYHVAVNVIASLPVTLVSGDRDGRSQPRPFPENETDFLEVALQPFAASADAPLADLIGAKVIGPQELHRDALEGQRVVVLANVQALSDEQVKLLRAFVEAGGALLIFPGDRVDVQNFNDQLHALGRGLSPASITGIAGKGLGFDDGAVLLDERHEHPALALWNDPANGALGTAQFDVWYRLQPDREAQTIARLTTGHPFLVRHEWGQGVVIVGASAVDTGWGNLPTTPIYLPLMQRLIAFAATHAEPDSNVLAGKPITAILDAEPDEDRLVWQLPDGSKTRRRVEPRGGRWACTLEETAQPGYYRLLVDGKAQRVFAVNLPREESDLRRLSDEELKQLAESIGATIVDDAEAYAAYDQTRRHGRPFWRVMWVMLLALVFGEMLLQQWFGKGGRA